MGPLNHFCIRSDIKMLYNYLKIWVFMFYSLHIIVNK